MNSLEIIKCVKNVNEFDPELFDKLSVGIEIQDFYNPNILDTELESRLNAYKEKINIFKGKITLHGSSIDLNPGSPDKRVVEITRDRYIQSIYIAKMLTASNIIFHSQINPWLREPKVQEIKINRQASFWQTILSIVDLKDIMILLENVYEDNFEVLLTLIQRIDPQKIKICLDIGHILVNPFTSVEKWILGLKPYIDYFHFHWNNSAYDQHESPNDDFMKQIFSILVANDIKPIISLEYKIDDLTTEVNRIRDNYIQIIDKSKGEK